MQTITTEELKRMKERKENLPLVNVLDAEQYRAAHIPGSVNIPVDDTSFLAKTESLVGDKQSPVVVYCASQECPASPKAAKLLDEAGYKTVYDYEGGTEAWRQAGQPVEASA